MLANPTVITGVITDENNNYISQAIIQVIQIDKNLNIYTDLGYTVSDINGRYKFILMVQSDMFYEFTIFPQLQI